VLKNALTMHGHMNVKFLSMCFAFFHADRQTDMTRYAAVIRFAPPPSQNDIRTSESKKPIVLLLGIRK